LSCFGLDKDGKVTVLINTFTIQGVTFVLPGAVSGSATGVNEQMPGAGKTLQFQNGTVFEMWVAVPSTYGKTSGAGQ
jgi:hypothetical protein